MHGGKDNTFIFNLSLLSLLQHQDADTLYVEKIDVGEDGENVDKKDIIVVLCISPLLMGSSQNRGEWISKVYDPRRSTE